MGTGAVRDKWLCASNSSVCSPSEASWPGVSLLPDYSKITFPDTAGVPHSQLVPEASPAAADLLSNLVLYDSARYCVLYNTV